MKSGKVLVAGATGRVGSAAVEELLAAGFGVRALVRRAEKGERLRAAGAEVAVGDVTAPRTLIPAMEGCSGVLSALSAGPGRGTSEAIEHTGNLNLLSAARSAGVSRFVYSSALMADHPLARDVGSLHEKARFEKVLLAAEDVSSTILRPAIFMETMLMMLRGPVAFVPGRQRRPVSWISTRDIARAAARAFQLDILGRHEISGPDTVTFDEAFERLGKAKKVRIFTLHLPLKAMRAAGRASPYLRDLAGLMGLFELVGYATSSTALRDTFGIDALTIEQGATEPASMSPARAALNR
jgi:uncharacterized protein YbjT (DUF2867 family)